MPTVTVITGASGGIGAALARRLGREGHRLVLGARREQALREVVGGVDGEAIAVPADVTRREDVERLRAAALQRFGQIDAWVNNAGRGITVPVLELTDAQVDDIIAVNVKSALYGMQAIVPYFRQRGHGHLINVSSFLGRAPVAPLRSIYSAAKAMLNSLTANLRMDLSDFPEIHVSLVMPGLVATEFAKNAGTFGPPPAASRNMGVQSAEEVADLMADLIANPRPELYTNPRTAAFLEQWRHEMETAAEAQSAGR
jgi:short-subunit dehydrogenase